MFSQKKDGKFDISRKSADNTLVYADKIYTSSFCEFCFLLWSNLVYNIYDVLCRIRNEGMS